MTEKDFNFEAALSALQSGQALTGKDGILTPLIKQLTEAALAHRSPTVSTITTGANIHNFTQSFNWQFAKLFFNKLKPHDFSLVKNWVAFFRISLSSRSKRISLRNCIFS